MHASDSVWERMKARSCILALHKIDIMMLAMSDRLKVLRSIVWNRMNFINQFSIFYRSVWPRYGWTVWLCKHKHESEKANRMFRKRASVTNTPMDVVFMIASLSHSSTAFTTETHSHSLRHSHAKSPHAIPTNEAMLWIERNRVCVDATKRGGKQLTMTRRNDRPVIYQNYFCRT